MGKSLVSCFFWDTVYNAKAIPISIPDPIYMALNEYHRSLMSIFREISAVICILNTLWLFQVRDFIYLRLLSAKVLA